MRAACHCSHLNQAQEPLMVEYLERLPRFLLEAKSVKMFSISSMSDRKVILNINASQLANNVLASITLPNFDLYIIELNEINTLLV
jgi:hypothetical protein